MNNRRFKVVYVSDRDLIDLFHINVPLHDLNNYRRLRFVDLPEDYVVAYVSFDFSRQCFGIVITHPSFPEVPIGAVPEPIEKEYNIITVNKKGEIINDQTWRERASLL